jgi:DNA-binding NarL/FixJ family response regulator
MQTVFDDDEKIFQAICAGASGYILKKSSTDFLIEAIREVYTGGAPMTPSVAKQVLQLFSKQANSKTEYHLTAREKEILQLLSKGKSYKMIAADLFITFHTVNEHVKRIYEKLHVNTATEAVSKAIQERLI